jgi:hypothetical protein
MKMQAPVRASERVLCIFESKLNFAKRARARARLANDDDNFCKHARGA